MIIIHEIVKVDRNPFIVLMMFVHGKMHRQLELLLKEYLFVTSNINIIISNASKMIVYYIAFVIALNVCRVE